jgi:hypothetical protein
MSMRIRSVLEELEAHFHSPQPGSDIQGKSEWKHYGDGTYRFKVSIRGISLPDGSKVDLWLDDRWLMQLAIQHKKAKLDIENDSGSGIPVIKAGQILQVKSGQIVLAEGKYESE